MPESTSTNAFAAEQLDQHLDAVEDRLIQRYPAVPADTVRRLRHAEADRFDGARVRVFVPILVERAVRDAIEHDRRTLP